MELTIDQALQKGIEAHKAGKVQEADQYYTAILQAQPTHPDANHNMGVLAVSVGKADQALPFFKKALDANSTVEQFWISYIDALIKAQKPDEARAALAQAKDAGVRDITLDQLKQKLVSPNNLNEHIPIENLIGGRENDGWINAMKAFDHSRDLLHLPHCHSSQL